MYTIVMDGFEVLLHGDKAQRSDNIAHLNEINKKLIIYGSDGVIKAYQAYLRLANSEEAKQNVHSKKMGEQFNKAIGNILVAIRRDMGNKNTKIKGNDLLYQFDLVIEKTGEDAI